MICYTFTLLVIIYAYLILHLQTAFVVMVKKKVYTKLIDTYTHIVGDGNSNFNVRETFVDKTLL